MRVVFMESKRFTAERCPGLRSYHLVRSGGKAESACSKHPLAFQGTPSINRSPMKTHLVFALLTAALLALVISQSRQKTLTFQDIINQAQAAAAEKYRPVKDVDSERLRTLTYDQYRDLRWKEDQTLWRRLGLPFQVKFFTTGHLHNAPVDLFQVNRDSARPLKFSSDYFDFGGGVKHLTALDRARAGYAGFRVHYPLNKPDYLDEVMVFLGGSYFRAVAKDQQYGLSARGLAIDTVSDSGKEEFPVFTSFWLVQPGSNDRRLKLYALLDGPSVSGAYEFIVEPGEATRFDVHAVLFFRKKVSQLGIAPMSSMFWYGENTSNTFGGFRPEVHDSDGLLMQGAGDEWIWRPLSFGKKTQVNAFVADHPRGFGLLQRDRDFSHYQDLEAKYERRPSTWIEPRGDWGPGSVKLVQFPTDSEYWDNVVAFWQPARSPEAGERLDLRYTLWWQKGDPHPPALATTVATRVDYQDAPYFRVFALDFASEELSRLAPETPLQADLTADNGGQISKVQIQKNTNDNTWRVTFTASTETLQKPVELRCILRQDGRQLSETWTSTWIPR
jgi:glucans biosynthesis protein